MFLFPNAKINIGLNIISKTNSGYHQIQSCFCPISLYDSIEISFDHQFHLWLILFQLLKENCEFGFCQYPLN